MAGLEPAITPLGAFLLLGATQLMLSARHFGIKKAAARITPKRPHMILELLYHK